MREQFRKWRDKRKFEWQMFIHTLPASPHIAAVKRHHNPHLNAEVAPEAFSRAVDAGDIELVATALRNFSLPRAKQRQIMHRTVSAKAEQLVEQLNQLGQRHIVQTHYLHDHGTDLPEEERNSVQGQIGERADNIVQLDTERASLQHLQGRLAHPRLLERFLDHLSDAPRYMTEQFPKNWRRWFPHPIILAYTPLMNLKMIDASFKGQTVQPQHAEHVLWDSLRRGVYSPTAAAMLVRHDGRKAREIMEVALDSRMQDNIQRLIDVGLQGATSSMSGPLTTDSLKMAFQRHFEIDGTNLTALRSGKRRAKYYYLPDGSPVPSLPKRIAATVKRGTETQIERAYTAVVLRRLQGKT